MQIHHASTVSPSSGRLRQAERPDIEPAGSRLQRLAQELIHRGRSRLGSGNGTVSFGRSVASFLPEADANGLPEIANRFRRLLVMGENSLVRTAIRAKEFELAEISNPMPIIAAEYSQFGPPAAALVRQFEATEVGRFSALAEDAESSEIREIQELQIAVGLTPLPGAFLRGAHGRVASVLYRAASGRLLGSATLVDLADAGRGLSETAILVGVSVAPEAQNRGLGSAVTAAGLIEASRSLGAHRVIAVVSPTNTRAFKTNAKFGLHPIAGQSAVYIEVGLVA